MNSKQKLELTNRLALLVITLRSVDTLTTELLATINIGDGDVTDIVANGLTMLQRAAEHLRYFQSISEIHNASRDSS